MNEPRLYQRPTHGANCLCPGLFTLRWRGKWNYTGSPGGGVPYGSSDPHWGNSFQPLWCQSAPKRNDSYTHNRWRVYDGWETIRLDVFRVMGVMSALSAPPDWCRLLNQSEAPPPPAVICFINKHVDVCSRRDSDVHVDLTDPDASRLSHTNTGQKAEPENFTKSKWCCNKRDGGCVTPQQSNKFEFLSDLAWYCVI